MVGEVVSVWGFRFLGPAAGREANDSRCSAKHIEMSKPEAVSQERRGPKPVGSFSFRPPAQSAG